MTASHHRRGRLVGLLLVAAVWLASATVRATEREAALHAALESITAEELQCHVDYLAADERQGRLPGSAGSLAAAEYLVDRFREFGLRGAGPDGGFFQPFPPNFRNVVAMLEGSDPQLKKQVVVVGAHYDHVGYGNRGNSRGGIGRVHNGADDNASGTAAVLEVAEAFATLPEPPRRSVLFICFDAEEKGFLGSKYWVSHPTVPLSNVAFMINMDMVGRLRDDRVILYSTRSGYGSRRLISLANQELGLELNFMWGIPSNSDQHSFSDREIPVALFHTGLHDDYHTPRDDARLINAKGMRRVSQLAFRTAYSLADGDRVPAFRPLATHESEHARRQFLRPRGRLPDRFGAWWSSAATAGSGVLVTGIVIGSPAGKAGLRSGDRILRFAGRDIQTAGDLTGAVTTAESPASLRIRRSGETEPIELTVELVGNPTKFGISWRRDEAEPGTIVLTRVIPGTPAALAGLKVGDRIYRVAGQQVPDDQALARIVGQASDRVILLVERKGRLSTVTVEFHDNAETLETAA